MLTNEQIAAIKAATTLFRQRAAFGDHSHSRHLQALLAASAPTLTGEQIESLAHHQAHRYRHGPDSIEFIFNRECLLNFARALLAQGE